MNCSRVGGTFLRIGIAELVRYSRKNVQVTKSQEDREERHRGLTMRPIYRAGFPLGREAGGDALLNDVAAACVKWVTNRREFNAARHVVAGAETMARTELAESFFLETTLCANMSETTAS